jgi:hypothetical protein
MRYTGEERKQIYLDALELLAEADIRHTWSFNNTGFARYACHAISQATKKAKRPTKPSTVERFFPEAYAFRSNEYNGSTWLSEIVGGSVRFTPGSKDGNELRQLVLIFAAELCDDPEFLND